MFVSDELVLSRLEEFSSTAEEQLFRREEKSKDKKSKGVSSGGFLAGGGVALAALIIISSSGRISAGSNPCRDCRFLQAAPKGFKHYSGSSGWGINARMRLTTTQAASFAHRPDHNSIP